MASHAHANESTALIQGGADDGAINTKTKEATSSSSSSCCKISADHVVRLRKGASVVIGMLCMLYGGTIYLFGTYMSDMGTRMGYDQQSLALIATLGQSSAYLAQWGFGFVVDKWGYVVTMAAALLIQPLAYGLISAMVDFKLGTTSNVLMTFLYILAGIGGAPAYIAPLSVNVRNFANTARGVIVGIHVALFGLSTLIFSQIYQHLFVSPDGTIHYVASFVEMIAISGAAVFFLSLFLLYDSADYLNAHFTHLAVIHEMAKRKIRTFTGRSGRFDQLPETTETSAGISRTTTPAASETERPTNTSSSKQPSNSEAQQSAQIDIHGLGLIKEIDYWLLFFVLFMCSSAGLMYINNISAIIKSLAAVEGLDASTVSTLIATHASVLSACSCAGRLILGVVADLYLRELQLSRRVFIIFVVIVMTTGQLIAFKLNNIDQLYACTVVIGFAYGSTFCLIPTLVGDLFGTLSFGTNWGSMLVAPAVAGPITNILFGHIYDSNKPIDGSICVGHTCYYEAFAITVGMCALATLLAIIFTIRHRLWARLHPKLQRQS